MSPFAKALLVALLASALVAAVAFSLRPHHTVVITLAPD